MANKEMIEHLNIVLGNELIAINQYILHSRMFKEWGYGQLAEKTFAESIDEMKHADILIQRILYLKGIPNLQHLGKLNIGENPKEMLASDLELERLSIKAYQQAIMHAEQCQDFGTRDKLKNILMNEEEHVEFLETQLELMKNLGEAQYLSTQL